jgi:hypothetical protein
MKHIVTLIILGALVAPADACPSGYYYSDASRACVERPDHNDDHVTADCQDGTESHSQHHSGTCSGHGGVRNFR